VRPIVLALRCPGCGADLLGTERDVVFWCRACRVPFEVVDGQFQPRRGLLGEAEIAADGEVLHLPLWAFRVRYSLAWPDPERERLARQISPVEWVYVTGFSVHNAWYFGDAGQLLTERRPRLRAMDDGEILGCVRGAEDAKRYVEPHLLTLIDRRVDVTGLTLRVAVSDVCLWGVPYYDEGEVLRDGILGQCLPAAALDGLGEIRQMRKR
jgi:hypothetical protein